MSKLLAPLTPGEELENLKTSFTKEPKLGRGSRNRPRQVSSNSLQASEESAATGSRRQITGESSRFKSNESEPEVVIKRQVSTIITRLPVIDDCSFFKGTSQEFRQELIPHLARLRFGKGNDMPENRRAQEIRGLDRQGLSGWGETRDTSQVRILMTQAADATEEFDGLMITDGRFDADVELIYNNVTVASLRTNAVFGTEHLFGVTEKPLFGIRLRMDPSFPMHFVPRQPLVDALANPAFSADRDLLYERVHNAAATTISNWFCQNSNRVKIKLFANVNTSFKTKLIHSVSIRVYKAGQIILEEGETATSCIFVYHGEAKVLVPGGNSNLYTLAHMGDQSAAIAASWAGWWSLLEATGACSKRPTGVAAVTDCTVWFLEGSALNELRDEFPKECAFLDKVAVKHMKLLSEYAIDFFHVPMLKECESNFLAQLECVCTHRILSPGEYVVKEGETGTEMFLLTRGSAAVYRAGKLLGHQSEGACFGELAVLGITATRTASILCETVCDLRVLDREHLLEALTLFPSESARLGRVAEAHGYSRKLAIKELKHLQSLQGFSDEFVKQLSEQMHEQTFFLGQQLVKEDDECYEMFVVTGGLLALEVDGTRCAEVAAPAIFCETALLNPGSHAQATIRCLTLCDCFAINTREIAATFQADFPDDMKKLEELSKTRQDTMAEGLLCKFSGEGETSKSDTRASSASLMNSMHGTFFADSDAAFLEQLSLQLQKCIFFDGQAMLREGDAGDCALLINNGTGVVEAGGVRVAEIKRGDFVGEVVLLGVAECYSCTIRANGLVTAFSVNKKKFQEVIANFPDEKKRLEALMRRRVSLTGHLTSPNQLGKSGSAGKGDDGRSPREFRRGSLESRRRSSAFSKKLGRNSVSSGRKASVSTESGIQEDDQAKRGSPTRRNTGIGELSRISISCHRLSNAGSRRSSQEDDPMSPLSPGEPQSWGSLESIGSSVFVEKADQSQDGLSDVSEGSNGCMEWERERKLRQSGPAQLKLWVTKRNKAIKNADWCRSMNLKRVGRVAEFLPPTCSFRCSEADSEQSLADLKQGGAPDMSKLKKATSVYGRPVWHEVYGEPVKLPPITPR